jgi:hypothetical protein
MQSVDSTTYALPQTKQTAPIIGFDGCNSASECVYLLQVWRCHPWRSQCGFDPSTTARSRENASALSRWAAAPRVSTVTLVCLIKLADLMSSASANLPRCWGESHLLFLNCKDPANGIQVLTAVILKFNLVHIYQTTWCHIPEDGNLQASSYLDNSLFELLQFWNTRFWDIMPISRLKLTDVSENHLTSSGLKISQARSEHESRRQAEPLLLPLSSRLLSCSGYPSTLKMEAVCSSETSVDSANHRVIFQKMERLLSNAVRTSDPTQSSIVSCL